MSGHLASLEAESIEILRDAVALAEKAAMMYSIGKDCSVMTPSGAQGILAGDSAVSPAACRHDKIAAEWGMKLLVHTNHQGIAEGVNPFTYESDRYTTTMKTEALKQALDPGGFDLILGGARRDEEESRAKERSFSFRPAGHRWDPKLQRPESRNIYNARIHPGESIRVFPLSNWTEADIWQ